MWKWVYRHQITLFSTSAFAYFQFYEFKELLQSFEVIKQAKIFWWYVFTIRKGFRNNTDILPPLHPQKNAQKVHACIHH